MTSANAVATPMMRQYLEIRRSLPPGSILLFRLGDFYEMFGEDARTAAPILDVALTRRGDLPMCGVPYHAARGYIEKLVAAGCRVAICDQVGEVRPGKLVRREVTEILSAGTLDCTGAGERAPRYLAAACPGASAWGLALCDMGTGEFLVLEAAGIEALTDELARYAPAEILVPDSLSPLPAPLEAAAPLEAHLFSPAQSEEALRSHYSLRSLDGLGCSDLPDALRAAGALLHYLTIQLRRNASHLRPPRGLRAASHLLLDAAAQAHLELVSSRAGRGMTLLGVLDDTASPMGARTLREWMLRPLRSPAEILKRQEAIAALLEAPGLLEDLRGRLSALRDIQRCVARLNGSSGNARDLAALAASLAVLPAVKEILARLGADPLLSSLEAALAPLPDLARLLESAIVDEPPPVIREGGMIRDGFDPALDELRAATREGKSWIAGLQEREIARTGIKSLKVRFTSVFGYFIEVTKANLQAVPADYIRRQTTVNGERFITPELKEMEGKIVGAEDRARARELEIFHELRARALEQTPVLQANAEALGALDALAALASAARLRGYCRPVVEDSGVLEIREGRHPVLDAAPSAERFVPNDTLLDTSGARFAIITGPNMAGKSTYLRQTALLVLMAQMGSFIPAASARIGVVDRIFTRVGASDD
ncbi:MAG: DNA mismatch repair protein MutS, partial [Terrimicrobiaceae bacterium]|nr:DNA mismatch repair protein MutS [Terrimicrobiaceae bacterium]